MEIPRLNIHPQKIEESIPRYISKFSKLRLYKERRSGGGANGFRFTNPQKA